MYVFSVQLHFGIGMLIIISLLALDHDRERGRDTGMAICKTATVVKCHCFTRDLLPSPCVARAPYW
jgi:hypothetical protein